MVDDKSEAIEMCFIFSSPEYLSPTFPKGHKFRFSYWAVFDF